MAKDVQLTIQVNPNPVDTGNEYLIRADKNLPNHSMSLAGRGSFVRQSVPDIPTFRTKQAAFRYAAWLIEQAEQHLPDEEGAEGHTFTLVHEAITANQPK